ncbi:MAG: class I SAM-dependent methyltransferase [Waddliaceae bacterium]
MKIFTFLFCILISSLRAGEVPEPYASIVDLPFDGHGWFYNKEPLLALIEERRPITIIEVGAWLGLSTRFFASQVEELGGKVYAVDHWLGSNERAHLQDPRLPYLYHLFLSNIKHTGFAHVVVPVRMHSLLAAKALNVKADLIYIDSSHKTEDVIDDILAWTPHLKEGGLMCGDDWKWGSVRKAVVQAAKELNQVVHSSGNFWWFE